MFVEVLIRLWAPGRTLHCNGWESQPYGALGFFSIAFFSCFVCVYMFLLVDFCSIAQHTSTYERMPEVSCRDRATQSEQTRLLCLFDCGQHGRQLAHVRTAAGCTMTVFRGHRLCSPTLPHGRRAV
jgi:hypothetical protein